MRQGKSQQLYICINRQLCASSRECGQYFRVPRKRRISRQNGPASGGGGIYKGGCQLAIDNMNALLHHKLLYTIRISCVKATGSVGSISGCRAKDA